MATEPEKPIAEKPKSGVYWPTVVLGIGAAGVAAGIALRQLQGHAPKPAASLEDDRPAPLSAPSYQLSAPVPVAFKEGRPVDSAAPTQDPEAKVAGAAPAVAVDSSRMLVRDKTMIPADASGAGDPFTDSEALRQDLHLSPDLSFFGNGGPAHFATKVLFRAKDWKALWKKISQGKPPAVDFSRQMLVGVFAGRSKAGSGIEIVSISQKGGKIKVLYRRISGAHGAKGPAWKPCHIKAIARSSRPVVFEEAR